MDKPLLPSLRGALRGRRGTDYDLAAGFQPGDCLHLLAAVAGHPAGAVLPVLGQCLSREAPDQPPYALVAYVPVSATEVVAYAERPAARFEVGQHAERWFGGVPLFFALVDLTDHAEALRLERPAPVAVPEAPTGAVVRPLYPVTRPAAGGRRQAA